MEEADIARLSRATRAEIASISTLVRQPHEENVDYARRLLSDLEAGARGSTNTMPLILACVEGLCTVGEGVEDAETMAALAACGCTVAQGYHIARPLPVAEFDRWYAVTVG